MNTQGHESRFPSPSRTRLRYQPDAPIRQIVRPAWFALLIFTGGLQEMVFPVEITAHRGASHLAPENTLASVKLAWQLAADSVEIDVYQSKDGRIVVIHDETAQRTAGIDWKIATRTLAELKTLDVGRWKEEKWAGQQIPTLEEVLRTIPAGKRLLIEVKCGKRIVPEIARLLKASGKRPDQTVIISFDFDVVAAAKARMPRLTVLWLLSATPERDKQTGKVLISLTERIEKCCTAGLDGLSVSHESELSEDFVKQIHRAGLQLHVWTVNSAREARNLAGLGVDAITTDRPGRLRAELQGTGKAETAELTVELGNAQGVAWVGAIHRWDRDGNHRRPVDPKAKILAPYVDFRATSAGNNRWIFQDLPPGKYDLLIMAGDHTRIEGFQYVPVREFDPFLSPDATVDDDARRFITDVIQKSRHYENKVVPLYLAGDKKVVRVLVMLIRDKPTSYEPGRGTIRHEIWQYTWQYGGWQKERRTKVLDRILLQVAELRRWTWLWDPRLGGIDVKGSPITIKYELPKQLDRMPLKGLHPY